MSRARRLLQLSASQQRKFLSARRLSLSWTTERARVASLTRSRPQNDPDLLVAKSNLKAELYADHVRKLVNAAPPLTAEQRDTIMAAFAGFTPGGDR